MDLTRRSIQSTIESDSDASSSTKNDCVQLIQACDSLTTVPPNAMIRTFAPSKMSRQPIRVAKPPPPQQPRFQQQQQQQRYPQSYNEIVRMAEQQRRLIDANQREIEQRELRPERVENAAARLAALRNEVLREEREMARLNAIQREARETFARRLAAEKQLHEMQNTYTSQEDQLRTAASRIDSLKSQLDLLYRRRMSAVNAARAQQNRFNSQTNSLNRPIKKDNSSRISSGSFGEAAAPSRPQASVEPFQITRPTVVVTKPSDEKRTVNTSVVVVPPPPPPVPPTPQSLSSSSSLKTGTNVISPSSKDLTDRVVFRKPLLNEQLVATNRDESPSPPKDPYPSLTCAPPVERPVLFVQKSEPNLSTSVPVASVKNMSALRSSSANVGQQQLSPQQILSTPSAIPSMTSAQSQQQHSRRSTNMHNLWNEAKILDQEALLNANDKTSSKCDDNGRVTMSDQISIRADTLRAAKRRSWAQQETLMDEAEYIRKILCEQQKKGRTHLNLDPHLKNLLNNSPVQEVVNDKVQPSDPVEASVEEAPEVIATTSKLLDETTEAVSVIESDVTVVVDSPVIEEELITEKETSTGGSSVTSESQDSQQQLLDDVFYESMKLIKPPPDKGILRPYGLKKPHRNIVFDPLALLLDAALEGEMDLVKASAAKMSDLSASNDEGITALHNAICAGHYEIVRFLVESAADVNAQDSDGWTPLHCAASCNNLPMVKLLVENGACVFAQTLSDLETPAEKCEEDEDGYEGCQLYLQSAHTNAGLVNEGKMYAAYSYENVRDDELSFHKGECLRVLERDGEERFWWLCERISRDAQDSDSDSSAQRRGLVPRNYLSLYPTLSDRSDSFTMFDLPTVTSSVDGGGNSANKSLQETNSVNIINHNNVINIVDCEDNNNNNKNTNNNLSTNVIKIDLNDQMCNSENEQIPPALLSVS